jgi:methylenetetrahydrofolate reductase (NADPH)
MTNIINLFSRKPAAQPETPATDADLANFLDGFSIEVMPRTAAKIDSFAEILPTGTRVYIAHLEGTPIEDMVSTAQRIADEGFPVMPHFPARGIASKTELADWIDRYQGEAGIDQALLLGGGYDNPVGDFTSSMDMIETGLFDGFKRLHVAGHPEGNKDIDPDGSDHWVATLIVSRANREQALNRTRQVLATIRDRFNLGKVLGYESI